MDSMARDLNSRDTLVKNLKKKITHLEDEYSNCTAELNECVVTRDSLMQQKADVERELKVFILYSYTCKNSTFTHARFYELKLNSVFKNISTIY